MTNNSGGKCFIWFIILCFSMGGFMLWRKFSNPVNNKSDNESNSASTQNLPIFNPDELCYLLQSNNNIRAGKMHDKGYRQEILAQDSSYLYHFNTKFMSGKSFGYVKTFSNKNFYEIAFNDREDYDTFRKQFYNFQKLGPTNDCLERYLISENCIACEIEFKLQEQLFFVRIMQNADNLKKNTPIRVSPKPKPEPKIDQPEQKGGWYQSAEKPQN